MSRTQFLKNIIRTGLILILSLVVIGLGKKIVTGSECTGCPGKGICNGESDCTKFAANTR